MTEQAVELLRRWVLERAGDQRTWLEESIDALAGGAPERDLHILMGLAPRRLGKADLALSEADLVAAEDARSGWNPANWSIDGATRVLALLTHHRNRPFAEIFKDLRRTADAAEMIALYRGLPLYPEPESLDFEVGEGLRSNIGSVFAAIAHDNPYPRDHFDDHRWNHMVLKALFVGARLAPIVGLDARANRGLAVILHDYAHERWAAGRPVTPELWRPCGPFASGDAAIADLKRALTGNEAERCAAALALNASPSEQAKDAIPTDLSARIADGTLTWDTLGDTMEEAAQ